MKPNIKKLLILNAPYDRACKKRTSTLFFVACIFNKYCLWFFVCCYICSVNCFYDRQN